MYLKKSTLKTEQRFKKVKIMDKERSDVLRRD